MKISSFVGDKNSADVSDIKKASQDALTLKTESVRTHERALMKEDTCLGNYCFSNYQSLVQFLILNYEN